MLSRDTHICKDTKIGKQGKSRVVQWLRFHTFTAVGLGSIPGQGTELPQAIQPSQKIKDKQRNEERQTQASGHHRPGGEDVWEGVQEGLHDMYNVSFLSKVGYTGVR